MVQKNNEKTKKKQHARLPAQMPVSGVSRSPGGNNRQERKDAMSSQKRRDTSSRQSRGQDKKRGRKKERDNTGLPQRVGAKGHGGLGSEEPSVPSYAWQNDVEASVDNTCRKLRVFFRCTDCHNETSAFAGHRSHSVRNSLLPLPPDPCPSLLSRNPAFLRILPELFFSSGF